MSLIKKAILIFIISSTSIFGAIAQDTIIQPDSEGESPYAKLRAAHDYSETGKGIGIYVLAGNEFDHMNDADINEMFHKVMEGSDINVKVYIRRTNDHQLSLFKAFVDGEGIATLARAEEFKRNLTLAVQCFRENRQIVFKDSP